MKPSAARNTSLQRVNPAKKVLLCLQTESLPLLAAGDVINVINLDFSKAFGIAFQEIYLTN